MKKRITISLCLLLFLSTYNSQNHFNFFSFLNIKNITIKNNYIISDKKIIENIKFINGNNIIFLNTTIIKEKLNEIDFIDSFKIKKKYPNTINITIFEKQPIAILQNKKKKYYYTANNDIISFSDYKQFKDLPIIFGNKENFQIFFESLKKINFPIEIIDKFYFFESRRWDLITKRKQIIKLPIKKYEESLINFMSIQDKYNFEKYKIFDYRIKNQLILK